MLKEPLSPRFTPQAEVEKTTSGWRLQIPEGKAGQYRLAQLDDYGKLRRQNFAHHKQGSLSLKCRVSAANLPGTWGFGFWNDPFAFALGLQGGSQKLPALPNACWFFNASPENHLTFRDQLPGHGFLVQTFHSPKIPALMLLPGLLGAPLMFFSQFSRVFRKIAGNIISQDGTAVNVDTTQWHSYQISWKSEQVLFLVDQTLVFETNISPQVPLGTVIWIDNQFAAWAPDGKIGMGTLKQADPGWLELEDIQIQS